jgi:hypothetical protein
MAWALRVDCGLMRVGLLLTLPLLGVAQSGCGGATAAAVVPRLVLGLRSARTSSEEAGLGPASRVGGWDVRFQTSLSWTANRALRRPSGVAPAVPDSWRSR